MLMALRVGSDITPFVFGVAWHAHPEVVDLDPEILPSDGLLKATFNLRRDGLWHILEVEDRMVDVV